MSWEPQDSENGEAAGDDRAALVALLYDNAICCLKSAVQAVHSKQIETRWKHNRRAQEIINQLYMMLDLDRGGEIASNLEALYTYMLLRLPDVDIRNEARAAEEVIELLEPLRASWKDLARNQAAFGTDRPDIGEIPAAADEVADRWMESNANLPLRHAPERLSGV